MREAIANNNSWPALRKRGYSVRGDWSRSHTKTLTQDSEPRKQSPDEGHDFSRAAQPATIEGFSP